MTADPVLLATAALAAGLYLAGAATVARRRARPWPAARTAAFAGGVAAAVAALQPPLAARAHELLSAHMWQHMLLALAAAPLIVAGAPLSLALQALRGPARARIARAVRSAPARALAHPVTAWSAFAATVLATHLTGAYDLAVRDGAVHAFEHALYLGTGMLFWAPVLGSNPVRRIHSWLGRLAYVMLAMLPMSAVAAVLVYADAPRYPAYETAAWALGVSALGDQREAGAIMATVGGLLMVAGAVALAWQALMAEERRQRVLDDRAEGGR